MPVVDLNADSGECDVVLNAVQGKADASSPGIVYQIDLMMNITSADEAELAGKVVPGVQTSYAFAGEDDDWKSTSTVRKSQMISVDLIAKEPPAGQPPKLVEAGESIVRGMAEIKAITVKQSKRAQVMVVKLAMHGKGASLAGLLFDNLACSVGFRFAQVQTGLPFGTSVRDGEDQIDVYAIVAATLPDGAQIVGRVFEIDANGIQVSEAGKVYTVNRADVISSFRLSEDASTIAALADYTDRCAGLEMEPSWSALVDVLRDSLDPDQTEITVSQEQVIRAVESLIQPNAPAQPDEEPAQVIQMPKSRKPRAQALA